MYLGTVTIDSLKNEENNPDDIMCVIYLRHALFYFFFNVTCISYNILPQRASFYHNAIKAQRLPTEQQKNCF